MGYLRYIKRSSELSLKKPFLLTVFICGLLIISGSYTLPIQADEGRITPAEGMEESVVFSLAIEEDCSKTADVNELDRRQVVNEAIAEIPKAPSLESGYLRIIGIIIGICSLLVFTLIYLIKKKKI